MTVSVVMSIDISLSLRVSEFASHYTPGYDSRVKRRARFALNCDKSI